MPTNAKKRQQIAMDFRRTKVAQLAVEGWSQPAIAKELKIALGTVNGDLKAIRQEWRDQYAAKADELVDKELAKLDHIECEAWKGFYRSLEDKVRLKCTEDEDGQKNESLREPQSGNPAYMDKILRAMERRAKLLGWEKESEAPGAAQPLQIVEVVVSSTKDVEQYEHFKSVAGRLSMN
jgi:hypothetical protein